MAQFEERGEPAQSLAWRSRHADALLNQAEVAFRNRDTPAGNDRSVRLAIANAPLEGRGYRLLAREAELRGHPDEAARLYSTAAGRSPRDLPSQAWLAQRELAAGEFAPALARFDQMQRAQPEISLQLTPLMIATAEYGPAQADFARLLIRSPPWRTEFMQRLISQTRNLPVIFGLVEQLRLAPGGLSETELRSWLDRLAADRQWGPAYLTWVQSLTPEGSRRIGNIAETEPLSGRREWRGFEIAASVPRDNCGGQWLTLRVPARIPAEQRIGGVAWFDDLQIKAD
ncbi:MAG: hypothetical protein ABI588_10195 [Arenimonas sp.]